MVPGRQPELAEPGSVDEGVPSHSWRHRRGVGAVDVELDQIGRGSGTVVGVADAEGRDARCGDVEGERQRSEARQHALRRRDNAQRNARTPDPARPMDHPPIWSSARLRKR